MNSMHTVFTPPRPCLPPRFGVNCGMSETDLLGRVKAFCGLNIIVEG